MAGGLWLVHIVWAPLDVSAVERFVAAYKANPPGEEHRLAVIYKGFASPEDAAPHEAIIGPLTDQRIDYTKPTLDLPAYAHAAAVLDADHLCFVNSESVPLVEGWLAALAAAVRAPGVGAAGATGSYETTQSRLPWRRGRWPAFPNPHLRTNAFMISRDVMRGLDWPDVENKTQAWELESGHRGMTRQLWARGLQTLIVGRDGCVFPPQRWAESATFRSGDQANLLVADNRTRQWEAADPAERAHLSRLAWGEDRAATAAAAPAGPGAATSR
jgi:hypothetical protein